MISFCTGNLLEVLLQLPSLPSMRTLTPASACTARHQSRAFSDSSWKIGFKTFFNERRCRFSRKLLFLISFTRVVDVLGPLLSAIIGERIQDSWDSVERVKKITAPALYLSGARDILVPPSLMETLCLQHLASCPDGATLTSFPDGGHNTTHLSPTYFDTIARFVSTMLDRSTIQSGL